MNALPKLLYDNALAGAGGTLAAGSTDAGTQYNVANLIDGRTHTLWKGANASDNFVQITGLSPTLAIDSIGIVGHNLGTIGADVDVQQWNGSSWIAIAGAGPWSPTSDKPFFRTWSSSPLRTGFRINLTSMSAAPQIAVLIIGTHFTFEWWLQAGWDPTAQQAVFDSEESGAAHHLGTVLRFHRISLSPSWELLTPAWVDSTLMPAWIAHLGNGGPFVWAWDATDHPDEVFWLRVADNQLLSLPYDPSRRSLTLNLVGARDT